MLEPRTPEEWQDAVDVAHVLMLVDSARQYGLVKGGPEANVERCEAVLQAGRERGILPAHDVVEQLIGRMVA